MKLKRSRVSSNSGVRIKQDNSSSPQKTTNPMRTLTNNNNCNNKKLSSSTSFKKALREILIIMSKPSTNKAKFLPINRNLRKLTLKISPTRSQSILLRLEKFLPNTCRANNCLSSKKLRTMHLKKGKVLMLSSTQLLHLNPLISNNQTVITFNMIISTLIKISMNRIKKIIAILCTMLQACLLNLVT